MKQKLISMLKNEILPFWMHLRDNVNGGFYGYVFYDGRINKQSDKGAILHSRILWSFSRCFKEFKNPLYLDMAHHAYQFIELYLIDRQEKGLYWMVDYQGNVVNDHKHIYNIAFAIYALSEYYAITENKNVLYQAIDLFNLIEAKGKDEYGYLEEFDRCWNQVENIMLGEALKAEKTMNTHLHVLEAYTNLYRVSKNEKVKSAMYDLLNIFKKQIYKDGHFLVFFNARFQTIADMKSFGHDIEGSWLLDEAVDVLDNKDIMEEIHLITTELAESTRKEAYFQNSVINEEIKGHLDLNRVWWVQAESVVGFYNYFEKYQDEDYFKMVEDILNNIRNVFVIPNLGEWYAVVDKDIKPTKKPIVEPWKCPYHNVRMCLEIIRRYMINDDR